MCAVSWQPKVIYMLSAINLIVFWGIVNNPRPELFEKR